MKIFVLGETGMAGSMITHYLREKGHDVTGFSRKFPTKGLNIRFEAHSQSSLDYLNKLIRERSPDAIINCIGYLVKESENNPAEAVYLNSYFPRLLENITKDTNTKIIHISTDCVFNGKLFGGYSEYDIPTETNFYGRSKALGELNNSKDITLRQSIIGPAPQASNTGFFNWILTEKASVVEGWKNSLWNGITTLELAKQIENILLNYPKLSGIVNLVPCQITTKYDLICMIVAEWKLSLKVKQVDNTPYSFKVLAKSRNDVPIIKPTYKEQLKELHKYINKYNIEIGNLK